VSGLFIFAKLLRVWNVAVYLTQQTNTATMNKQSLLLRIGSQLMNDAREYMNSPERPCFPTNDNQPKWFIAVSDACEDIDSLLFA
jgi:hypothetical protein